MITGLMPTYFNSTTSWANRSLSEESVIAWPPYFTTTVLPRNVRMYGKASIRTLAFLMSRFIPGSPLENVAAEILIFDDVFQSLLHIGSRDADRLLRPPRSFERNRFQQSLQDGEQAAGTDIFGPLIDLHRDVGDGLHSFLGELHRQAFSCQQCVILTDEGTFGLRENTHKIFFRQGVELDTDRKSSLKLGDEIRGLGHMERPRGNEQDVVREYRPMLRRDRAAFHDRQQVALHPFSRHIRPCRPFTSGDFVDFIQKDDFRYRNGDHRLPDHIIHIDQFLR